MEIWKTSILPLGDWKSELLPTDLGSNEVLQRRVARLSARRVELQEKKREWFVVRANFACGHNLFEVVVGR